MSTSIAAASAKGEYCSGCCVSQERGCVVLGYAMTAVILSQERKKHVCSSYSSSNLLPASYLLPVYTGFSK